MYKEYKYRKHITTINTLSIPTAVFLISVLLIITAVTLLLNPIWRFQILRLGITVCATVLFFFLFIKLVFLDLSKTKYIIDRDTLKVESPRKNIKININGISDIRLDRFLFLFKFGSIITPKGRIVLPPVIKDFHSFLSDLENLSRSEIRESKGYRDLKRYAFISDTSDYNAEKHLYPSIKFGAGLGLFAYFTSITIWAFHPLIAIGWAVYTAIIPMLVFIFFNWIYTKSIKNFIKLKGIHHVPAGPQPGFKEKIILISSILFLASGMIVRPFYSYLEKIFFYL
ncbi:MAG: hypothetical protein ACOCSE_00300 [Chitinivibrionales bacterium]